MKIDENLKVIKNTELSQELSGSVKRVSGEAFRRSFLQALEGFTSVTVQKGDTLIGMTRKHLGTQASHFNSHQIYEIAKSIAKNNGLTSADHIRQGQNLNMPSLETLLEGFSVKKGTLATNFSSVTNPPVISLKDGTARNMPHLFDNLKARHSSPQRLSTDAPLASASLPLAFSNKAPTESVQASARRGHDGAHPRLVIVGDSIAVGIGGSILKSSGVVPGPTQGAKFIVKDEYGLSVDATGGHSTPQILKKIQSNESVKNADTAVISAATNDWVNMSVNPYYTPSRILQNLNAIRSELNAKSYIWVLPYEAEPKALVKSLAQKYGDQTIDLADFRKVDKYHPREYTAVAASVNQLLKISDKNSPQQETLSLHLPSTPQVMTSSANTWQSTAEMLQHKGTVGNYPLLN